MSIKTIVNTSDKHSIDKIRVSNRIQHDPASIAQAFNELSFSVCSTLLPDTYVNASFFNNFTLLQFFFFLWKILPTEFQNVINELNVNSGADLME